MNPAPEGTKKAFTDSDHEIGGSAGWVVAPGSTRGEGIMEIDGREYPVKAIVVADILVGYRIGKYEICVVAPANSRGLSWKCTCSDFMYRRQGTRKGCKHTASLMVGMQVVANTMASGEAENG